jgi:hypothetical protein
MTLVTVPLQFIFSDTNLFRVLTANFIILPLFEVITALCYFLYFSGVWLSYIPGSTWVFKVSGIMLSTLFAYLEYLYLNL